MSGGIYGPYARAVRWLVRRFLGRWQAAEQSCAPRPAAFVARHQDLAGPVLSVALLEREVRVWVLHVFFTRRDCFGQYYGYTFTKRFGWPKPLALCAAAVCALLVPPLLKSLDAIPVYRGSAKIAETLKLSAQALAQGESVLICPDRDYTDTSGKDADLYRGFLHLERHAAKAGAGPVSFVPLCPDRERRRFSVGQALRFSGKAPFKAEQAEMALALAQTLDRMHAGEI